MKNSKYKIVDDFQVGETDTRVLVLDRDYDLTIPLKKNIVIIDGKEYKFHLNSISRWATIESKEHFTGKTIEFI